MDITWFGATCFRLRSGQLTILTDPFDLPPLPSSGSLPDAARRLAAEIVTVSDRAAARQLAAHSAHRLVDGPGEYEIRGVPITGVATPLAAAPAGESGSPGERRQNVVYSMLVDGVSVCHLGRLSQPPSAQQIQEIGLPDVVLIPLGEQFGLTPQRAGQLATQLESKLLIPMVLDRPGDRAVLEAFCRELGADPNAVESRLTVTHSGLPAQARVAVLARQEPS
jgi:L-ascorbate metabolism protein UlaG (beta-lactamase superfamily)